MTSSIQIRVAILTISDRSARGERPDASGPALAKACLAAGFQIAAEKIVPDESDQISAQLEEWCDTAAADLILTTGGTGFARRDITPEATMAVVERPTPGLTESMRAASLRITPHAMLSRAAAGIRGHTLIVNLPGSPKAAIENLQTILGVLPHAIELLQDAPDAEQHH